MTADALLEIITDEKRKISSPLYECKFQPKQAPLKGNLGPESEFESGVYKIQSNATGFMTNSRKKVCEAFLVTGNTKNSCARTKLKQKNII